MEDLPMSRNRSASIACNTSIGPRGEFRLTRTYSVPDLGTRIADSYYQHTVPATNVYKPWVDYSNTEGYWFDRYRYWRNYFYNTVNPCYNPYRHYPFSYSYTSKKRRPSYDYPYLYQSDLNPFSVQYYGNLYLRPRYTPNYDYNPDWVYKPERYTKYWSGYPGHYSKRGIHYWSGAGL